MTFCCFSIIQLHSCRNYSVDNEKKGHGVPETTKVKEGSASRNIQRKSDHNKGYVKSWRIKHQTGSENLHQFFTESFFFLCDICFYSFPSILSYTYIHTYIHSYILIAYVSINRKEHKQGGGGIGGKGDWKVTDDGSY